MGPKVDRFLQQADYCVEKAATAVTDARKDLYRRLALRYRGLANVQAWLDRSDRDHPDGNDRGPGSGRSSS
jgi:hypothetical protein